jgi:uncharacterized membrane protein YjgN (DUF898 family)
MLGDTSFVLAQAGPSPTDVSNYVAELLKLGVAGCFILFLIWTIWRQDTRYSALHTSYNLLLDKYVAEIKDCSEKRIAGGVENTKILSETVETVGRFGAVSEKQAVTLEKAVASLAKLEGVLTNERRDSRR